MTITKIAAAEALATATIADAIKVEEIAVKALADMDAILVAYDGLPTQVQLTGLNEAHAFRNSLRNELNQIKMRREMEARMNPPPMPTPMPAPLPAPAP